MSVSVLVFAGADVDFVGSWCLRQCVGAGRRCSCCQRLHCSVKSPPCCQRLHCSVKSPPCCQRLRCSVNSLALTLATSHSKIALASICRCSLSTRRCLDQSRCWHRSRSYLLLQSGIVILCIVIFFGLVASKLTNGQKTKNPFHHALQN